MKDKVPKNIEEWSKQAIPILEKYELIETRRRKSKVGRTILFAFLWLLTLSLVYFIGAKGFFTSNQNVTLVPTNNITNDYSFATPINNQYAINPNNNFSIYNNVIIPSNLCG